MPQAPTAKDVLNMLNLLKEVEKKLKKLRRKNLKVKRNVKSPTMQEKLQRFLVISSTALSMKLDSSFRMIPMKMQLYIARRLNSDAVLIGTLLLKVLTSKDAQNSSLALVTRLNMDAALMKSLLLVDPTSKDVVSLPVPLLCMVAAKTERPLPSVLTTLDVKDLASLVNCPPLDAALMEKLLLWVRTALDAEPTASSLNMDAVPMESRSLRVLTTKDVDANMLNSDAVLMERPLLRELASMAAQVPVLNLNMDAVPMERLPLEEPTKKDAHANTLVTVAVLMEKLLPLDLTMMVVTIVDMPSTDAVLMEKAKLLDQITKDVLQLPWLHSFLEALLLLQRLLLALSLKIKVTSVTQATSLSGSTMPTKADALNSGTVVVEVTKTDSQLKKCARLSA